MFTKNYRFNIYTHDEHVGLFVIDDFGNLIDIQLDFDGCAYFRFS
jgi:hypothetical protein